jgi:succinate dehydrogenase / fumarate reductase, membrane anchor subunit
MDLRSNLSKARGLGSAHEGAHHWWMQRVTAIALIPLTFWFVSSVIKATSLHGIDGVMYMLSSPLNAIAMILFLGTAIYHGTLGIKVIVEDYVHCPCGNKILDIATKLIAVASIVAVSFSIFLVHAKTYDNAGKYQPGFWNKPLNSQKSDGTATKGQPGNDDLSGQKATPIIVIDSPKE